MTRPLLLDTFCGGGGCSVGYNRAGFDVIGIDREAHPDYPFPMIVGDAMEYLADLDFLAQFDVVHASPPCQAYSDLATLQAPGAHDEDDVLPEVRVLLLAWGGTYVIENVPGAPLINPVTLCGSEFGLGAWCFDGAYRYLKRHRLFESDTWLMGAGGCHHRGQAVGVYGNGGGGQQTRGYKGTRSECREAMAIDWMRHEDISQAIPPAYTEFLGAQLLDAMERAA